jgi:DNA polymerase III delta prime subunit
MTCGYCKSEVLFLKDDGDKTGLYCKDCGRWLKWVEPSEKAAIAMQIEKLKNEISIDARDVERVIETYKGYKKKSKDLNEEIFYFSKNSVKGGSDIEKSAMYSKALKLKELAAKISAYEEIIMALGINK